MNWAEFDGWLVDQAVKPLVAPRWTKLYACVRFALDHPSARIVSVGKTETHWVFAIE